MYFPVFGSGATIFYNDAKDMKGKVGDTVQSLGIQGPSVSRAQDLPLGTRYTMTPGHNCCMARAGFYVRLLRQAKLSNKGRPTWPIPILAEAHVLSYNGIHKSSSVDMPW